jgi:Fe-S-cluster containining protein
MKLPHSLKNEVMHLFADMDRAYDLAAAQAGFACHGCVDNCCQTRFYHHTLMELLYLRSGLAVLPAQHQIRIRSHAREADRQMALLERRSEAVRVMCPLNEQGRCVLYACRPMICRLHGIPHGLRRPDGRVVTGPGCDAYEIQCATAGNIRLDRSLLYTAMAGLERKLRDQLGFNQKIKLTVAQMIIADSWQF